MNDASEDAWNNDNEESFDNSRNWMQKLIAQGWNGMILYM